MERFGLHLGVRGLLKYVFEFWTQLLVSEGFTNLEEVAYVEVDELLVIDGVDEDTAGELQARARDVLEAQNKAALDNARALGVEDSLVEFEGLTPQMIEALAKDDPIAALRDFERTCKAQLANLAGLARGKISKLFRMVLGALITIDVHARDLLRDREPAEQ